MTLWFIFPIRTFSITKNLLKPVVLIYYPRSPVRSSGPPKANVHWHGPVTRSGVPHISVQLPPDFSSHTTRHFLSPDGRHDGGRRPRSTRGVFQCVISDACFFFLTSQNGNVIKLFLFNGRYWVNSQKMWTFPRAPSSMPTIRFPQVKHCLLQAFLQPKIWNHHSWRMLFQVFWFSLKKNK